MTTKPQPEAIEPATTIHPDQYSVEEERDLIFGPEDPAQEAHYRAADAYVNDTVNPETGRGFLYGFTPEELSEWHRSLPQDQRDFYDEELAFKYERDFRMAERDGDLLEGLRATAPELLEGRLPADQEKLLGSGYVLGTNQNGVFNLTEAVAYVTEASGIDVTNYNLNNRFQFFDPTVRLMTILSALGGYFGEAGGGRFVVAVPDNGSFAGESVTSRPDMLENHDALPEDFMVRYTRDGQDARAVSPRYIAGFIGVDGRYYSNAEFMQDSAEGPRFELQPVEQGDWL